MARKPKNEDIGEIRCPFTGDLSPVRRDCNGKLYYVGKAGMIKPNMPTGQNYMLENATIWGAGGKPHVIPCNPANDEEYQAPLTGLVGLVAKPETPVISQINTNVPVNGDGRQKPVNGDGRQKPVNGAESEPVKKPSFAKWLIG